MLKSLNYRITIVALTAFISLSLTSCFKEKDVAQTSQPTGVLNMSPSAGTKSSIVSISGTNFPDKSQIQVKINGVTAPVVAGTGNNIQVQVPTGTGTGPVSVTFGGATYNAGTFTYLYTYTVTPLTNGTVGTTDGPVATASFEDVESVAIDNNNNLYVGNYYGTKLRKINLGTGVVSTVATQTGGNEFVSTDQAGNIYYTDEDNNQIVKVTPTGTTTVLAVPTFGIQSIKVARSGNIYVSGTTSIAKYSPTGTLVWRIRSKGSGVVEGDTSLVRFNLYGQLDVDTAETKIYLVQNNLTSGYPSSIRMLDMTTMKMSTIAGSATSAGFADGQGANARFALAYGVTIDNKRGGLYVADNGNAAIRYIDKNGYVTTVIGGNGAGDRSGIGTAAQLNGPQHVGFDTAGNMYIADWGNTRIYKVVID